MTASGANGLDPEHHGFVGVQVWGLRRDRDFNEQLRAELR